MVVLCVAQQIKHKQRQEWKKEAHVAGLTFPNDKHSNLIDLCLWYRT